MKKNLIVLLLSAIGVGSARADLLFYESFNYTNGVTEVVSTNVVAGNLVTNWFRHNPTTGSFDSFVNNNHLEISATGGTPVSRADDIHRFFTTNTNAPIPVYASFTVNCTNLPPVTGTYFAHFYSNSSSFHGRVFAQVPSGIAPNTWRLGIAAAAGTVSKIFPVDLATNTDYQVVVAFDASSPSASFAATLWVNPTSSNDVSVASADAFSLVTTEFAYGIRQPSSFGNAFFYLTNLATATTWDEAATSVWSSNAVAPVIVYQPTSRTNFVGDPVTVTALANGQGLGAMTYQWQKDGANISNPNGNSNAFSIASAVIADTGNYTLIATTPLGISATSAVAFLWITNAPIPPSISVNPSNVSVFYHQSASLNVVASGPPPLSYQWYYTNAPATGANVSGTTTDTISITDVQTNNGTAGPYFVVVCNPYGCRTSAVATVTAVGPPNVSIAYLRTLLDTTTYNSTNTALRWTITNVTVTTYTNLTSGDTSSYYVQDATAGLNIFMTHAGGLNGSPLIRFAQGTVLDFTGWQSTFNSTLELEGDTADPTTYFFVHTNLDGSPVIAPVPAPMVIPFNITNNLPFCEYNLEGKEVMLTNVYFGTNAGIIVSNLPGTIIVSNTDGETFHLAFSAQDLDTAGGTLPAFAYSVVGVFNQNLGNAVTPRNAGYQVELSRFSDIVTDPPPDITLSVAHSGIDTSLSWQNAPWDNVNYSYGSNYSYSVLCATDVGGPYAPVTVYQAMMKGVNEVPVNGSSGIGFGTVGLSADQSTITVNMRFTGLSTNATVAHIHGPAGIGTNASVIFPFTGVPTATSGSIPEQTFTITPTQLGYLQNGLLYMNVHNSIFPGGELRGQILLVPATGLTFANSSFTNLVPTTATFKDPGASGPLKFYRVVSP